MKQNVKSVVIVGVGGQDVYKRQTVPLVLSADY